MNKKVYVTPREKELIEIIKKHNMGNKELAERMNVTPRTITQMLGKIYGIMPLEAIAPSCKRREMVTLINNNEVIIVDKPSTSST